ncbi:hypothetical protein C8J57DRAFT_1234143 [Mycena rebaudengoi]|nr:hypothetical protein C8J57DRAFT_1234143 [Mycena rebaudengoi]
MSARVFASLKTPLSARFLVSPAILLPCCAPSLPIPHSHPRALSDGSPNQPPNRILHHRWSSLRVVVYASAARVAILPRRLHFGVGAGVFGGECVGFQLPSVPQIFTVFSTNPPGPARIQLRLGYFQFTIAATFLLASQRLLCPHLHAVARAATPAGPDRFADAISRLLDVTNPGWFIDARSPRPQDLGVFLGGCFSANLASCMFSRPSIAVIFVWEFREECIGDDRPVLECSAGSSLNASFLMLPKPLARTHPPFPSPFRRSVSPHLCITIIPPTPCSEVVDGMPVRGFHGHGSQSASIAAKRIDSAFNSTAARRLHFGVAARR